MRQVKFSLTFSDSYCCNPDCLRPLYVELMADEFDEVCYSCHSDREHPPLVLLQGGRSTAAMAREMEEHWEQQERVKAAKLEHGVFHCEEACCNAFSISFVSPEEIRRQKSLAGDGNVA